MCGIVGLHVKDRECEKELGRWLEPMLDCMASRGTDSTGLAVYSAPAEANQYRYSIRLESARPQDGALLAETLATMTGRPAHCERSRPDGVVLVASADWQLVQRELAKIRSDALTVGYGRTIEVIKDIGAAPDVCRQHDVVERTGYQAIGHTRMATESAVTPEHSHPFTTNDDLAVVHNGSFSNPATVRRRLIDEGVSFTTDNDTEVAARLIGRELATGADLRTALKEVENIMDGFYTLLVATEREFAAVRDSFACKPLVIAETDAYVAAASEYIAMASLPGIETARVFEPKPEEIHVWTR